VVGVAVAFFFAGGCFVTTSLEIGDFAGDSVSCVVAVRLISRRGRSARAYLPRNAELAARRAIAARVPVT
jgi:hypothetical protein